MPTEHLIFTNNSSIDVGLLITALDTVSDGLMIFDNNYKILYKNVAADYLLGGIGDSFEIETWNKKYRIYDIKFKKELGIHEMPIFRTVSGLKFTDYRVYITSDTRHEGYYISCNGTPLIGMNNQIVGGVLTFRDVTSNYLSERILSQERAFFKNILDLIPASVFVKDETLNYYFTNQEFDQFFKEYEHLPREYNQEAEELVHRHDKEVLKELKAKEFDEVIRMKDGLKYFKTIRFPIYNQITNKVLICGIAFDVSERKNIEDNLAEERLRSINASKLASIGTLAGEIGHEINNPIAIIKSITFLLRQMIEDDSLNKGFMKEKIETIDATIERITQIIRSLKNLSRKSTHDVKEPFVLKNIFNDVFPLIDLKFKKNGIRFICDFDNPILNETIVGYHVQLGEVFLNLLGNAADAVQNSERPWVSVEFIKENEFLTLQIKDNGPGVANEIKDKIFEPFFTTKAIGKGTGLGLSISRNIIKAHGGELTLDPSIKGACFTIRVPKIA